jgi:hypothetical protein
MADAEAVAWLRRVIEGDKSAAKAAPPGPWDFDGDDDVYTVHDGEHGDLVGNTVAWARGGDRHAAMGRHIVLHQPRDVIADCEAKLGILGLYGLWTVGPANQPELGAAACAISDAVSHLASAYRHRDGYAEHWGAAVSR